MKKLLCLLLAAALLLTLTACNFTSNFHDNLGVTEAQCTGQVEEMLQELAEADLAAALEKMHPGVADRAENGLEQLRDYMEGRKVLKLNLQGVSRNTSSGSAGKVEQEQAAFQVVLSDGTIIYISAVYRTDNDGAGFVSFQLVLGVV